MFSYTSNKNKKQKSKFSHPIVRRIADGVVTKWEHGGFWTGPYSPLEEKQGEELLDASTRAEMVQRLPLIWAHKFERIGDDPMPPSSSLRISGGCNNRAVVAFDKTGDVVPAEGMSQWAPLAGSRRWFFDEEAFSSYMKSQLLVPEPDTALLAIPSFGKDSHPMDVALTLRATMHEWMKQNGVSCPNRIGILAMHHNELGRIFVIPLCLEHWLGARDAAGQADSVQLVEEMVSHPGDPAPFFVDLDMEVPVDKPGEEITEYAWSVEDLLIEAGESVLSKFIPPGGDASVAHTLVLSGTRFNLGAQMVKISLHVIYRPVTSDGRPILMKNVQLEGPFLFSLLKEELSKRGATGIHTANHLDPALYAQHHFMRAIGSIKMIKQQSSRLTIYDCRTPMYTGRPNGPDAVARQIRDPVNWVSVIDATTEAAAAAAVVGFSYPEEVVRDMLARMKISPVSSSGRGGGGASSMTTIDSAEGIADALVQERVRRAIALVFEKDPKATVYRIQQREDGSVRIMFKDAHFCERKGAPHRNNNIYVVVQLDGSIWKGCFSPKCIAGDGDGQRRPPLLVRIEG